MCEDCYLEALYEDRFYADPNDERDYEEEAWQRAFCEACGESPCTGLCLEEAYEPEIDDGPYHFIAPGTEGW